MIDREHDAARAILAAVEELLAPHVETEQLSALAERIVEAVAFPEIVGHPSPPWPPRRYSLPDERLGRTGKLALHSEQGERVKFYTTPGYYDDGKLGEFFVRQVREGGTIAALLDAIATAVSIGLQYGIPWQVFEEKLARLNFPPRGMTEEQDDDDLRFVSSSLDYVIRWIAKRQNRPGGTD